MTDKQITDMLLYNCIELNKVIISLQSIEGVDAETFERLRTAISNGYKLRQTVSERLNLGLELFTEMTDDS